MIIGLAGKSCSGKNRVARILENKGFQTLDLDVMIQDIQEGMTEELAGEFGPCILDSHGQLQRQILGNIVFSNPLKLKALEEKLYPRLHVQLKRIFETRNPATPLVLNAAALEKGNFMDYCDHVLWISAPWIIRLTRAVKRDDRSLLHLLKRFSSQRKLKAQYFFSRVDTSIIRNGFTRKSLQSKVEAWISSLGEIDGTK